jgi:dUTP pyrophosphatase
MLEVKIKYLDDIEKIEKIAIGDWIDLRASKDISLKKGEFTCIPLGVSIVLPDGYEALLAPRSSTFKKWHILQTNSVGVIDNSYLGEWAMPVYATEDTVIKKNDRICQFRIIENQPKFNIIEIDTLDGIVSERGKGGFGSTGVN